MDIFKIELEKKTIKKVTLLKYLEDSLNSGKEDDLCRGWNYLRENITPELKSILLLKEYWDLKYNSEKVDYILKKLGYKICPNELKRQLDAFVYVYNSMKRDIEKEYQEQENEKKLFSEGYRKIGNTDKSLHGLKVKCVMNISHIGMMGSFDKQEEKEGKLYYSEGYKALMLIPKRSRARGYIIRDFAYIKEEI